MNAGGKGWKKRRKREREGECVCERRREGEKRKEKDKQKKRQHSIIYAKGCDVMMLIMIPHSAQGRRGKEGRGGINQKLSIDPTS